MIQFPLFLRKYISAFPFLCFRVSVSVLHGCEALCAHCYERINLVIYIDGQVHQNYF